MEGGKAVMCLVEWAVADTTSSRLLTLAEDLTRIWCQEQLSAATHTVG